MISALLSPEAPAILTGLAAATCLSAAPAFRSRQLVLIAQLGAALCFAAHYLCLGITVAAAVNLLASVQTFAAIFSARSATLNRLGYALICLMALVCLALWQGPVSALSAIATILLALARMQIDEVRLRVLLLAGGVFWVAHDLIGEAWIALAADIGAISTGAVMLASLFIRVRIEWRPPALPAPTASAV
ncbi:YgjV family protein [Afifella sp. IM 167]|uniref:YgjV family protein n=1 Tax=Afifella sp. IM 167 TaxID=2033586 RepID=UPI001CCD375C|nr:YgjV family protein [Afifella sp. IM 167]MBZ8132885.1 hypothetical protein [Afifella sp. IM 167]